MFGAIAQALRPQQPPAFLWTRSGVAHAEPCKPHRCAQGDAVLDMACGTGDLTLLLARTTDATRVVGGDFTP